jgi:hypothetical protein
MIEVQHLFDQGLSMAVVIGFLLLLLCVVAYVGIKQFRLVAKLQRDLAEAKNNSERVNQEFSDLRQECSDLRRECKGLRDAPPMPSDSQLADHLDQLKDRLVGQAERLERSRIISAAPLAKISEMAAASRVVSRRQRLAGLQATLERANIGLAKQVDSHVASLSSIANVVEALRADKLGESIGVRNCNQVDSCVYNIEQEAREEADAGGILHRSTKEFQMRLALHDRGKELEQKERDEQRAAAALAFDRHKLPALTPIEKFRALKPFGQRDNLE